MSDAVPLLATMRVEAAKDKALSDVGYLQRKQTGMGYFMDGNQINKDAISFADVMRIAPGLKSCRWATAAPTSSPTRATRPATAA